MKTSHNCDWIQGTFPAGYNVDFPEWIPTDYEEIYPIGGYDTGKKNSIGLCVYTHSKRPTQGSHFVASGACLSRFERERVDFLRHVVEKGAIIKRIDLCIDVFDGEFQAKHATTAIEKGWAKTHAQQFPTWKDAKGKGYTQYVGKKTSDTYARIYDKAAEMNLDLSWSRIECVWKGKRGQYAAKAWMNGASVPGMIRGFVDFDGWDEWDLVMDAPVVKIKIPQKETDTRKWLLDVVTKAMGDEWAKDDGDDFIAKMITIAREWERGKNPGTAPE